MVAHIRNVPHRLQHLMTWPLVGGAVWVGIEGVVCWRRRYVTGGGI